MNFGVTLKLALEKLKDLVITEFKKIIIKQREQSGKLTHWCRIKQNFSTEKYLNYITTAAVQRTAVTKLRLSDHKLPIEVGRFCNPKIPRRDRICNLCPQITLGDEFHLICECSHPKLVKFRDLLFSKISGISNSFESLDIKNKFVYLLSCVDKDVTKLFCQFCFKMLNVGEKG